MIERFTPALNRIKPPLLSVNSGLAQESTRLPRMFNRPELLVIELT